MNISERNLGRNCRALVFRKPFIALMLTVLALVGFFSGGCTPKEKLKKFDLIGQLKKINQEVEGLNQDIFEVVETLEAMDVKEGGLEESKVLLMTLLEKTREQLGTSNELAEVVDLQRNQVATLLSIAQEVLKVEMGLKEGTIKQMEIAGKTLDLAHFLYGNLRTFEDINKDIGSKMDRALEIMRQM